MLPNKDQFYNTSTNQAINDKNYGHALHVWKGFKMSTMEDCNNLYLKVVFFLLVACVFEIFRKESINSYELDVDYYLSTLGYSWDAMLKFTDVNLKLTSDIEKYQFIESTIRGAISIICKEFAKASKKV